MKDLQLLLLPLVGGQGVLATTSSSNNEGVTVSRQTLQLYNGTHLINATYEDQSLLDLSHPDLFPNSDLFKRNENPDYDQDCKTHLNGFQCKVILPKGNCYHSWHKFKDDDIYSPGKHSGTCYRGCGTFVKGPQECRFSGKEMREVFKSMHDEMLGCNKCMRRQYRNGDRDRCEFKADYVSGCNGPFEILDPKNLKEGN